MFHVRPYIGNAKALTPPEGFIPNPKLKLLDQVSEAQNQAFNALLFLYRNVLHQDLGPARGG